MLIYKNAAINRISNSYVDTLFVWRDDIDDIYLMDNHRCALWCWEQAVHKTNASNFYLIHVDQHDDMAIPSPNAPLKVSSMSITDYLNSNVSGFFDFQWDNYIRQYSKIHPNLKQKMYFGPNFKNFSKLSIDLNSITLNTQTDFIAINLDMDLFFTKNKRRLKANSLNHMYGVCYDCLKLYKKYRNNAVFTIALSPTCCGQKKDLSDIIVVIKMIENVLNTDINKDVVFWDFLSE